jgi:uncharacterized membrane protein
MFGKCLGTIYLHAFLIATVMKTNQSKNLEALLVIVTGFLVLYFVFDIKILLYVALAVGLISILIKPLAFLLAKAWYKLGDLLGWIVSKIVLSLMFYVLLVPLALLHNLFNKNAMQLKNTSKSMWKLREHTYAENDFKNTW